VLVGEDVDRPRSAPHRLASHLRTAAAWPASLPPSVQALLAFLAYTVVAGALYAAPILTRFASAHAGIGGNDPQTFAWSLVWWPHAVASGQNPLFTGALWAPPGVSLAYVTTIPGPSLLLWPVTELFGPIATLNLLTVAAPALAGWAAFLVCRKVTGSFWPSLAGGYLFGFSTYMVAQLTGHPNLALAFPVPLAVYLVLRRVEGSLGWLTFVLAMAATLVGLFSIFVEVFATAFVFGGLALLGALVLGPSHLRRPLLGTIGLLAAAYALAALVVGPYVFTALREVPAEPIRDLEKASVDLLGFVVPRQLTLFGGERFAGVTADFTAPLAGDTAYMGIALTAMVVAFAVTRWRHRSTWLLVSFAVLVAVASLGPVLHVRGRPVVDLPWRLVERIPLIQNALPDRFPMYLALTVAVMTAIWLMVRPGSVVRWGLVVVAAAMLAPNLSTLPFHQDVPMPSFFTTGAHRRHIRAGEIVMIIPFGRGPGLSYDMLWQAETDMRFRLTTGNVGFIPPEHKGRVVRCLRQDKPAELTDEEFLGWVRSHRVGAVVVQDGYVARWWSRLTSLGVRPIAVEGVWVFGLPQPGRPGTDRPEVPPSGLPPATPPPSGGVRYAGYDLVEEGGC
jgi:hypothetical protein